MNDLRARQLTEAEYESGKVSRLPGSELTTEIPLAWFMHGNSMNYKNYFEVPFIAARITLQHSGIYEVIGNLYSEGGDVLHGHRTLLRANLFTAPDEQADEGFFCGFGLVGFNDELFQMLNVEMAHQL